MLLRRLFGRRLRHPQRLTMLSAEASKSCRPRRVEKTLRFALRCGFGASASGLTGFRGGCGGLERLREVPALLEGGGEAMGDWAGAGERLLV